MKKIFLLALFFSALSLGAQEELFHPKVQNYTYRDYLAGTSNWWVIEDDRGIIYIANREGILEYDGTKWTLIQSSEQEVARSLAKDDGGIIYAGFVGDVGYLAPDEIGEMQFVSLKNEIPEEYRSFNEVWRTYFLEGNIYFQTRNFILRWTGTKMEVLTSDNRFSECSLVRDELYVGIWNKGLCKLSGDEFEILPGGEKFADVRIYAMLPYGVDSLLIGTSTDGFFMFDGKQFRPFRTEIDEQIKDQLYSPCLILEDGRIVINTLENGVYILNKKGRVLQNFSKYNGMQDDVVDYVYVDSRGILWMALFNGIATVNLESEFSYLTESSGLPSNTVNDCTRHNGYFYVGTVNGVYYYDSSTKQFQVIEGTIGQVYQLLKHRDRLYAASYRMGLFEILGTKIKYVQKNENNDFQVGMMRISPVDNNRLYIGRGPGIASLYFNEEDNQFHEESYTTKIQPRYPGFEIDKHDNLWTLGSTRGTIDQLKPSFENNKLDLEQSEVVNHNQDNGLPSKIKSIMKIDGELDFLGEGFYGYDMQTADFYKKETFYSGLYKPGAQYFSFPIEDDLGRTWIQAGLGISVLLDSPSDGNTLIYKPFEEIRAVPIWALHIENDKITNKTVSWLSGPEGMVRYEGNINKKAQDVFKVLIREIKIGEGKLLFGGSSTLPEKLTIDHQDNNISFRYAAPFYIQEQDILYSTFLEGQDQTWSEQSSTSQQTYNNLAQGKYNFHVKAVNVYNNESEVTSYSFSVKPPIWQTWWMFGLYLLLLFLLIGMIVRWRTLNLKKYQKKLEHTIQERTLQVVEEKNKVEELYKYQSTLLSEVHHRVKNNLQLIISLLVLQQAKLKKDMDPTILDTLSKRINSISLIHEQLYDDTQFDVVNTRLYLEKLLHNFNALISEQHAIVELEVGDIHFNLDTITPLGLIWSELISNSLKYNQDKKGLKLYFKLEKREKGYFMHYHDNGKGYTNGRFESTSSGMGNFIIQSLARQLMAKTESYNSEGAHFTMEFEEKQISSF